LIRNTGGRDGQSALSASCQDDSNPARTKARLTELGFVPKASLAAWPQIIFVG
jgi:hypothetical protein